MTEETMHKYDRIGKLLSTLTVYKEPLLAIHEHFKDAYFKNPASCIRHHNWASGYMDHIYEVVEISVRLYNLMVTDLKAKLSFTREDVILVAYVHDINKLFRYRKTEEAWKLKRGNIFEVSPDTGNCDESAEVVNICARFGIAFERRHLEAISHHHGGFSDSMTATFKYPNSLTAFSALIHSADLFSQYLFGQRSKE